MEIWTVGHSMRSTEEFMGLLQAHSIQAVADVRRYPGSRRHPQFGQAALAETLANSNIEYIHFPELGGRRSAQADSPNTGWRQAAFRGYADYMMTEPFQTGLERLLAIGIRKRVALLCAEALWWRCHRGLIADALKAGGHVVRHISGPGKAEPHPFTSAARIVNGKLSYRAQTESLELDLS